MTPTPTPNIIFLDVVPEANATFFMPLVLTRLQFQSLENDALEYQYRFSKDLRKEN